VSIDWFAPQACTLPTPQRPLRVAEFDSLFAEHLMRTDRLEVTRARMVFGLRGVGTTNLAELTDRVSDLTGRESACCSFFAFTLTPSQTSAADTLLLDIEVPPEHRAVLAALVDRAVASGGDA
jgi:hypothetical protein